MTIKLNLGCGFGKLDGFINVDRAKECAPDMVFDLENPDWPWESNSVSEVLFNHALEHLGQQSHVFLRMMQELYRVCADSAIININIPHPRHDNFINDPTHVRIITPAVLSLFDRQLNEQWARDGSSNSPLAIYLGVDFVIQKTAAILTARYQAMLDNGTVTRDELDVLTRERNNVIEEYRLVIKARKPTART